MQYNKLGKTGLEVSQLGLGGHEYRWRLAGKVKDRRQVEFNPERKKVVAMALENGVNYFDTTFQEEVQSLGHRLSALVGLQDAIINGMIIDAIRRANPMNSSERRKFVAEEIEVRLSLLKRDYFDCFMLCSLDHEYNPDTAMELLGYYQKFKEQGKIRFLGVSCHWHEVLLSFLNENPPVDVVMFPYNYAVAHNCGGKFDAVPELLAKIEQMDLGMVAMKPLNWTRYGIPFTAINAGEHSVQELVEQNFAWQVANTPTHTTVVGVETTGEFASTLSGVNAEVDESMLSPYLQNHRRLDILLKNAPLHSAEVQTWIARVAQRTTEQDLGNDPVAYRDYLAKTGTNPEMSNARIT